MLKTISLFSLLLAQTCFVLAQNQLDPNITVVTVFPIGAELTHEVQVTLQPGLNTLIIKDVSTKILTRTAQVLDTDVSLINVELERRYSERELANMQDELAVYEFELAALNKKLNELSDLHEVEKLNSMFNFYERRGGNLKGKIAQVKTNISKAKESNQTLQDASKARLHLLVSNTTTVNRKISIRYLTGGAGWAPFYEVHASTEQNQLELKYLVKVMNQTGEDWRNVNLFASSASPLDEPTKLPEIDPWFITNKRQTEKEDTDTDEELSNSKVTLLEGVEYVKRLVPSASLKFAVPNKHTVPSNGAVYSFNLSTSNLPIDYVYHCVPSVDPSAYLTARTVGWDDLNLLDATGKVYLNGTMVGDTYIEPSAADDTLNIIIGTDDGVSVERTSIGNETFRKETSGKVKETMAFLFSVKNNLKRPATLFLFDQVPVSQINTVKVSIKESSGAKMNEENGEMQWQFNLNASQIQDNIKLIYTIEYPKESQRYNLWTGYPQHTGRKKFRAIDAPSF